MKNVTELLVSAETHALAAQRGLVIEVLRADTIAHPRYDSNGVKIPTSTFITYSESLASKLSDMPCGWLPRVVLEQTIEDYVDTDGVSMKDMLACLVYQNNSPLPDLAITDHADVPSINGIRLNSIAGFIYEKKATICAEFGVSEISPQLQAQVEARMQSELDALNRYSENGVVTISMSKDGVVIDRCQMINIFQKETDEFAKQYLANYVDTTLKQYDAEIQEQALL